MTLRQPTRKSKVPIPARKGKMVWGVNGLVLAKSPYRWFCFCPKEGKTMKIILDDVTRGVHSLRHPAFNRVEIEARL